MALTCSVGEPYDCDQEVGVLYGDFELRGQWRQEDEGSVETHHDQEVAETKAPICSITSHTYSIGELMAM